MNQTLKTTLQLTLSLTLALTGILAIGMLLNRFDRSELLVYAAGETCFATVDGVTVQSSSNADAVQAAIDAANPGETVKVAGTCAGVQTTAGISQTAYIDKNLTLRGGYTDTNWTTSDPNANPTTLDAQSLGRVVVITGTAVAQVENLTITGGSASAGAGLYVDTAAALTLNNSRVISNTATGINPMTAGGGGLGNLGQTAINGTTFNYNSAVASAGGVGNGPGGVLTIAHSTFSFNSAFTAGALGSTGQATVTASSFTSNTSTKTGAAIGNAQAFSGLGWMSIQNSTFLHNTAGTNGGAIDNDGGEMHVSDSTFTENSANSGGVFYNNSTLSGLAPTLTITDSTFISNTVSSNGGVLRNRAGQAIFSGSTLENNSSNGSSGAIRVQGGEVSLNNSTLSGNTAVNDGGALLNDGIVTLNAVTMIHNSTGGNGGGIHNKTNAVVTINNSQIISNTAVGLGGGVNNGGTFTLTNSTVSGNTASNAGGGLYNSGASSSTSMTHTTVTNNTAALGAGLVITNSASLQTAAAILSGNSGANDCDSGSATLQSNGYNLLGSGCTFATGSDISTTSPGLAPLADNGGGTWTHALLDGSPALDAIPLGVSCPLVSTDQRGVPRPQGDACDIGAYEKNVYQMLTVTLEGIGSGTVTSAPAGITCSSNCTIPFNDNTVVTLTATADTGSSFIGWSGGGCSGTGTCVVTMTDAVGVTAVFDKIEYVVYLPIVIKL